MGIDAIIAQLAIAESHSGAEALVTIARHRAELAQALADARIEERPDREAALADTMRQTAKSRAGGIRKPAVDRTA